jgi:hypothetical protein
LVLRIDPSLTTNLAILTAPGQVIMQVYTIIAFHLSVIDVETVHILQRQAPHFVSCEA